MPDNILSSDGWVFNFLPIICSYKKNFCSVKKVLKFADLKKLPGIGNGDGKPTG